MRALLVSALIVLPVPALADRVFNITLNGQTYTARVVTDEPSGHLMAPAGWLDENGNVVEPDPPPLDAGPFEPAVRIGGTDDLDTAIRVMSAVCGFDYEEAKHWGAYGDPVWTDPRNGEIVFWAECTP